MTYMRIRYRKLGGHYHCRVFTSQNPDGTYAKNGELVFDEREWPEIHGAMNDLPNLQFINEGEPT